jgi:hypothetical protein
MNCTSPWALASDTAAASQQEDSTRVRLTLRTSDLLSLENESDYQFQLRRDKRLSRRSGDFSLSGNDTNHDAAPRELPR